MYQVAITVNGQHMLLNTHNTIIYIHSDNYKYLDHIFVQSEVGQGMYIFGQRSLLEMLMDTEEFRYIWSPLPCQADLNAWVKHGEALAKERQRQIEENNGFTDEEIQAFARQINSGDAFEHWHELTGEDE